MRIPTRSCGSVPTLACSGSSTAWAGPAARVYETPDGRDSGAYIASRFARNVVERLMLELIKPEWTWTARPPPPSCGGAGAALVARLAELEAPETSLRSKLLKRAAHHHDAGRSAAARAGRVGL